MIGKRDMKDGPSFCRRRHLLSECRQFRNVLIVDLAWQFSVPDCLTCGASLEGLAWKNNNGLFAHLWVESIQLRISLYESCSRDAIRNERQATMLSCRSSGASAAEQACAWIWEGGTSENDLHIVSRVLVIASRRSYVSQCRDSLRDKSGVDGGKLLPAPVDYKLMGWLYSTYCSIWESS